MHRIASRQFTKYSLVVKSVTSIDKKSAILYIVVISLLAQFLIQLLFSKYHNAWLMMSSSIDFDRIDGLRVRNPLIGSPVATKDGFLFIENLPFYEHALFFLRAYETYDVFFVRLYYGFLASLAVPFLGYNSSFVLLNFVSWFIAIWAINRFSLAFSQSKNVAIIASIFCCLGSGFHFHIADHSAHILSFTIYYVGILLLFRSDVWRKDISFGYHLSLCMFFAACTLAYNTGIELFFVYCIIARKSVYQFIKMLAAAPVVILVAKLPTLINYFDDGFPALNRESELFVQSIAIVRSLNLWEAFKYLFNGFIDYLCCEPILLAFVISLGLLLVILDFKHTSKSIFERKSFFICVAYFIPILSGLAYYSVSNNRGYISYPSTIALYTVLSCILFRLTKVVRINIVKFLFIVLIGLQLYWVYAHWLDIVVPIKVYCLGLNALMSSSIPNIIRVFITRPELYDMVTGVSTSLSKLHPSYIKSNLIIPFYASHNTLGSLVRFILLLVLFVTIYFCRNYYLRIERRFEHHVQYISFFVLSAFFVSFSYYILVQYYSIFRENSEFLKVYSIVRAQLPSPTKDLAIDLTLNPEFISKLIQKSNRDTKLELFSGAFLDGRTISVFVNDKLVITRRFSVDADGSPGKVQLLPIPSECFKGVSKGHLLIKISSSVSFTNYIGYQAVVPGHRDLYVGKKMTPCSSDICAFPVVELRLRDMRLGGMVVLAGL